MDISDSDHQPSHSTENTVTNEPTDDKHHNHYVSWKHPSNHDARNACNSGWDSFLRTTVSSYSSDPNSYNCSAVVVIPQCNYSTVSTIRIECGTGTKSYTPQSSRFRDFAQHLASKKKDLLPNTIEARFSGTNGLDNSRAPLTRLN